MFGRSVNMILRAGRGLQSEGRRREAEEDQERARIEERAMGWGGWWDDTKRGWQSTYPGIVVLPIIFFFCMAWLHVDGGTLGFVAETLNFAAVWLGIVTAFAASVTLLHLMWVALRVRRRRRAGAVSLVDPHVRNSLRLRPRRR